MASAHVSDADRTARIAQRISQMREYPAPETRNLVAESATTIILLSHWLREYLTRNNWEDYIVEKTEPTLLKIWRELRHFHEAISYHNQLSDAGLTTQCSPNIEASDIATRGKGLTVTAAILYGAGLLARTNDTLPCDSDPLRVIAPVLPVRVETLALIVRAHPPKELPHLPPQDLINRSWALDALRWTLFTPQL